ncbi:MAG: hypothetical protein FJ189_06390 [Gammaproteobacteria bacterium]|nr:hypothetical protein [Gammaproteobacteria bacterium]
MRITTLLLVLVLLGLTAVPASTANAQQAPAFDVAGTDAAKVQSFLKSLQTAVAVDNRMAVAGLFSYPLEVQAGGQTLTLKCSSDLQAHYAKVFDATLKQAIASAKAADMFANAKGVMFDNGRVWFAPVGSKQALKITRINETVQQ